jgi:hypothetical protein
LAIPSGNIQTTDVEKKAFDTNSRGDGAPETQFYSVRELRSIMESYFDQVSLTKENVDDIYFRGRKIFDRVSLLSGLGNRMGLDIYFQGRKK